MAQETYKGGVVLSRPEHSSYRDWRPYAKVMWQDENGFHSHEIVCSQIGFDTEREAIHFGFAIARSWMDKEL